MSTTVAHSRIGASSMYRWSVCPASVRLSENIESRQSKYADEGTKAHEYAAKILLNEKQVFKVNQEIQDAVQVYVDYVNSVVAGLADKGIDDVLVEHRFDLSNIHEGLFGTADCVVLDRAQKLLHVIDYKHGAGIVVDVVNNDQLMYYGLGALLSLGAPVDKVRLTIVQPRAEHEDGTIRHFEFDAFDLVEFAARLKEFAEKTKDPNAPMVEGEHCRFCPAAPVCPLLSKKAMDFAVEKFQDIPTYDADKLSRILEAMPAIKAWLQNVHEFAYREAVQGRCPKGFKLVEKRATRKWAMDTEDTVAALRALMGEDANLFEQKLKSPAQIEKMNPKFKREIDTIVSKISSGATLAPLNDKRPAIEIKPGDAFSVLPFDSEADA